MKNFGACLGIILLLFAGFVFWKSLSLEYYGPYGAGPGLLPRWLSGTLAVLSILFIISSLSKEKIYFKDVLPRGKVLIRLLSIIGSIFLFILIAPYTGFNIASITVLMILLLPEYKWFSALGISTAVTVILFLSFNTLLKIPLPVNMWGW
nr:tripartite tricarboxylate transporter TctB family protein [Bacillus mesophilus]